MSSLNENIDEIFRSVAENYPLKISGADFNKLLKKMEQDPAFNRKSTSKNYKKIYGLLILFAFFLVCNDYHYPDTISSTNTKHLFEREQALPNTEKGNTKNKELITAKEQLIKANDISSATQNNLGFAQVYATQDTLMSKNENIDSMTFASLTEEFKGNILIPKSSENPSEQKSHVEILPENSLNDSFTSTKNKTLNHQQFISKKNKKFYVGILAGPDFSTIKMQDISSTGFDFGFIAGFEINKNWSIETGLIKSKKYYYTDGEYFSRKNITAPASIKILNANGNCNMLEMPINIHYSFKNNSHSVWFATAGITSYFMKNESYTYMYDNNGFIYPRTKDYNNASEFWASAITLGIGKKYSFHKMGELKIQPLISIPLKNVGIGELPITSASIQFSFTKKIF